MESVFSQIGPWLFLLSLGSGMGVPLGIPPGPDDPVISRVAPQECVFYTTWAAAAKADGHSKNQAEQLLAEPEVRLFVEHADQWLRRAVGQQGSERQIANLSGATYDTLLMVLRHQTAMFVSDVKVKGRRVSVKGGMVVALGSDAGEVRKLFDEHARDFFINLAAQNIETFSYRGEKWYHVEITRDFPELLVGLKDSYLVVVFGEQSADAVLARMAQPVPPWLVDARKLANFKRPTGMTYINLKRLREAGAPAHDARRQRWLDLLGLTQSPWVMSATGLVGPDVVTRTILPIEGAGRGILAPAEDRGLRREDLSAIPRDASMAFAARLNLQKTIDAVASAAKSDPAIGQAAARSPGPFQMESPAVLPADVCKSLGDHWCFYNSPQEGGMIVTGLTGVVPINDRKLFSKNYEAVKNFVAQKLPGDPFGSDGPRIRRFPFAGSEVHFASMGDVGMVPAWWAGEKQFVFALSPQSVKAYLSRPSNALSFAEIPEVAAELSGRDPLLAIGYLDAPQVFERLYPLLMFAAPSYLDAVGMVDGRRDVSVFPSLPSIARHLRPGIATLRRTRLGLELTSRGSLPGFGLAGPVMFLAWDSQWLNLVFGAAENNAPPPPIGGAAAPFAPAAPAPPAVFLPAPAQPAGGR